MFRPRAFVSAVASTAAAAGMIVAGTAAAHAAPRPATVPLAGSAIPFASKNQVIGSAAASSQLTIEVWLSSRDETAAASFATAVSTPGSAQYGKYLSPAAYTATFGATSAAAGSVESWLRSQGFTAVAADSGRDYVQATAPVSKIDAAFKIQLKLYKSSAAASAGPYALRGYSGEVSVPASIAGNVAGITGLDNAAPVLPLERFPNIRPGDSSGPTHVCSQYYAQHIAYSMPEKYGWHSFPTVVCGYSGQQMRSVYQASKKFTGKGETIALIELGLTPDMFLTLQDYAHFNGQPAPSHSRYREVSLGQGSKCGDPFNGEEQLDVEASYDMVPGANQVVIGGDSCNDGNFGLQGLFNADVAVLNGAHGRPLARIASNSWESGDEGLPGYLIEIENAYLIRAAAEGVGMYFSSGDSSGVETPSSDPWATAVGGTTLGIGPRGGREFETGWSTGISVDVNNSWFFEGEQSADGGGPSVVWAQPGYQRGVVPASLARAPGNRGGLVRSVPDISADGDPFTGFALGVLNFNNKGQPTSYSESDIGGTSLASPLVAGMVTAAQQGHRVFGFINPLLYKLYRTSAFYDVLPITSRTSERFRGEECDAFYCGALALTTFDDQSFSMNGYTGQVTLKGYDNMTGLGTPNGQLFIAALRRF
jgi:subtilase family serine protease